MGTCCHGRASIEPGNIKARELPCGPILHRSSAQKFALNKPHWDTDKALLCRPWRHRVENRVGEVQSRGGAELVCFRRGGAPWNIFFSIALEIACLFVGSWILGHATVLQFPGVCEVLQREVHSENVPFADTCTRNKCNRRCLKFGCLSGRVLVRMSTSGLYCQYTNSGLTTA